VLKGVDSAYLRALGEAVGDAGPRHVAVHTYQLASVASNSKSIGPQNVGKARGRLKHQIGATLQVIDAIIKYFIDGQCRRKCISNQEIAEREDTVRRPAGNVTLHRHPAAKLILRVDPNKVIAAGELVVSGISAECAAVIDTYGSMAESLDAECTNSCLHAIQGAGILQVSAGIEGVRKKASVVNA
jgi:hypothetical protein